MLRITVQQHPDSIALLLEGRLAGAWVEELRAVWASLQSIPGQERVVISLTEISGVDALGRCLLDEIHAMGGVLTGSGLLARTLIQDITGIAS